MPGSAYATARGFADVPAPVERVVQAYTATGRSLALGAPIPYPGPVTREARALSEVLNGKITAIRFETAEEDVVIQGPWGQAHPPLQDYGKLAAYGAIAGRIQTLSNRQGLRFTLYDSLHDRAVSCYLQEGQEELLRNLWGTRAIVHGWVS